MKVSESSRNPNGQVFNFHFWKVLHDGDRVAQDTFAHDALIPEDQDCPELERTRLDPLQVDESALTDDVTGADRCAKRENGSVVFYETGLFRARREDCSDVVVRAFEVDDATLDDVRVDGDDLKGHLTERKVAGSSPGARGVSGRTVADRHEGLVVEIGRLDHQVDEVLAAGSHHPVIPSDPLKSRTIPANA